MIERQHRTIKDHLISVPVVPALAVGWNICRLFSWAFVRLSGKIRPALLQIFFTEPLYVFLVPWCRLQLLTSARQPLILLSISGQS